MESSRPNYSAMTVNERLFAAGLLGEFDSAIDRLDRQDAIAVLCKVDLDAKQGALIVDTVLGDPAKYGFPRQSDSP
jgi:hypothetical protein